MTEKLRLSNDRVFIVGGYSHVPPEKFTDHKSLFEAVDMLLQYRYGLNPSFALRDNEGNLEGMPYKKKAPLVYQGDIDLVAHSGLVVAILDYPSTGAGHELQAAADNEIPIIKMIQGEKGRRIDVVYQIRNEHGSLEEYTLTRGEGGDSALTNGNPSVIASLVYRDYPDALKQLDETLQKEFGLTPKTRELESAAQIEETMGNTPKAKELRGKARLLDDLLEFKPNENTPERLRKEFPHRKRKPLPGMLPTEDLKPTSPQQRKTVKN